MPYQLPYNTWTNIPLLHHPNPNPHLQTEPPDPPYSHHPCHPCPRPYHEPAGFPLSPILRFFLPSLYRSTFMWDTVSLSRSGTLNLLSKYAILGSTRALTKQKILASLSASCCYCMPWWMMFRGRHSAARWGREKEFVYSHCYICWVLCGCTIYSTMMSKLPKSTCV